MWRCPLLSSVTIPALVVVACEGIANSSAARLVTKVLEFRRPRQVGWVEKMSSEIYGKK